MLFRSASGSCRGSLGCELWADCETPYAVVDGRECFFRPRDFVVTYSDPRLLIVRVSARRLACTIAVAHAPHSGEDLAVRDAWWRGLSDRLAGQPDTVLLVDANGRIGSEVSAAVGPGGFRQVEDSGGALFHRTLLELGLCVPATFAGADSSAFTWVSNGGHPHRIDFVAVPVEWGREGLGAARHEVGRRVVAAPAAPRECGVVAVDAASDWEDHFLVTLTVPLVARAGTRLTCWRASAVDTSALGDEACREKFQIGRAHV